MEELEGARNEEIGGDGAPPRYTVRINPRAKRMRLKVSLLGQVEVVVPKGCDRHRVAAFVARNEAWLRKTIARIERERRSAPDLYEGRPSRIVLQALGEEWQVAYRTGPAPRLRLSQDGPGQLTMCGLVEDTDACTALLRRWLARRAKEHLVPWLRRVSEEFALPFARVGIRAQRTRWGSCSSARSISLNCNLLFLEPELVRYLLIHELCHTVHLNHSPRYWALVASKEPDYKVLDARLRQASNAVPLWAQPS